MKTVGVAKAKMGVAKAHILHTTRLEETALRAVNARPKNLQSIIQRQHKNMHNALARTKPEMSPEMSQDRIKKCISQP